MATNANTALRLVDVANMLGFDGNFNQLVNILVRRNRLAETSLFEEANGQMAHRFSQTTSEPSGTWTQINKGVQKSKFETTPVTEYIGLLEDYSYTDERLLKQAPNADVLRSRTDAVFLAGMYKTVAATFCTGNRSTSPDSPDGLFPLDPATNHNRPYWDDLADTDTVINSSGTGGGSIYTSIIVAEWGDEGITSIYPRGSRSAGIEMEDLGRKLIEDSSGNPYMAYVSHFWINIGWAIKNPRAVQRICNIVTGTGTGIIDEDDLMEAINNLPNEGDGAVIYTNKAIRKNLLVIAKDKSNVRYDPANPFGPQRILTDFLGVPMVLLESGLKFNQAEVT